MSLFGSNPENVRDAWSEIIVCGWQWHSPDSFVNGPNMLEIDRLTIRLELFSVYRAIVYKEAIQIDLMQARRQDAARERHPRSRPALTRARLPAARGRAVQRAPQRVRPVQSGRRSTCPTASAESARALRPSCALRDLTRDRPHR